MHDIFDALDVDDLGWVDLRSFVKGLSDEQQAVGFLGALKMKAPLHEIYVRAMSSHVMSCHVMSRPVARGSPPQRSKYTAAATCSHLSL